MIAYSKVTVFYLKSGVSDAAQVRFFCCVLVLTHVPILEAFVFCSKEIFGCPKYRDCMDALWALPTSRFVQFFVEQQLRADFPGANWPPSVDPRPFRRRKQSCAVT